MLARERGMNGNDEWGSPGERREAEDYRVGENLYSLSVHELETRIRAYEHEVARLRAELTKKSGERSAADALFSPKT